MSGRLSSSDAGIERPEEQHREDGEEEGDLPAPSGHHSVPLPAESLRRHQIAPTREPLGICEHRDDYCEEACERLRCSQ